MAPLVSDEDRNLYRVSFMDGNGNVFEMPSTLQSICRVREGKAEISLFVKTDDPDLYLLGITSAHIPKQQA
jgi:hypothetical protein